MRSTERFHMLLARSELFQNGRETHRSMRPAVHDAVLTGYRVVIVGAGFGGLFAARFLKRAPVEITLVDRTNHHLFQPLLYQVATGILPPGSVTAPTREVLRKHVSTKVELGDVVDVDLVEKTVAVVRPDGRRAALPYDSLVVAAGVGQCYFGQDEFAEWAPGMKTLADALVQRERIFGAFENSELEDDIDSRRAWLNFVVVGGGPTGVEIWTDRGAREAGFEGQLPALRSGRCEGRSVRGWQGDPRVFR